EHRGRRYPACGGDAETTGRADPFAGPIVVEVAKNHSDLKGSRAHTHKRVTGRWRLSLCNRQGFGGGKRRVFVSAIVECCIVERCCVSCFARRGTISALGRFFNS